MRNLRKILIKKFIRERGAYFGVVGFIVMLTSVIVAFFLYTSVNPTFNVVSNRISDLGTGPNMSNIVYNLGVIITGFCQILFYLSLVKFLQNKKANTIFIQITKFVFLVSAIGLILLGIIPFVRDNLIFFLSHGSAAATHYVAGSFAFIFYGFFEILILKFSKLLGIISFFTGIIYLMLWVTYLIDFVFKIPQLSENYTLQWISLAGILSWSLVHSLLLIHNKKNNIDSDE
jgi:hypothetical membrane protein